MKTAYLFFGCASLLVHTGYVMTHHAEASSTSCTPSSGSGTAADGCSCEPVACDITFIGASCDYTPGICNGRNEEDCTYYGLEGSGYRQYPEGDATVCSTATPLVAGGCTSSSTQSFCKWAYICTCDIWWDCQTTEEEQGPFYPCHAK